MELQRGLLELWPAVCCVLFCLNTYQAAPVSSPSAARALLQSAAPDGGGGGCSLSVGPQPTRFSNCTSVKTSPQAVPYTFFYTLGQGPTAGSTLLKGGLEVAAGAVGGQWAGFGVPAAVGQMLGTRAVIVKQCTSCPSGASVDGYVLKDYKPQANVAGSWPLNSGSASMGTDGTLRAIFEVVIPISVTKLTAYPLNIIYAIGPVDSSDNLLPHTTGHTPFGATKVPLSAS